MMLWLSIGPGDPTAILNPESPMAFAHGIRAVFPLAAAGVAAIIVGVKTVQRSPRTFGFFGPLGLTTAYGLSGLVAALKSPDGSVALWWTALYLSVPIVLWGAVWGAAPLDQLRRLVNATWLVVILASAALFVVAVLYLDFVDKILNPNQLLQCKSADWFELTGGRLRGTGVSRYAAIGGLIAISGLWQGRWRPVWFVGLLTSVTLLLYTSARGSFVGFAFAAALILSIYLCYASKRVLLTALLVILVSVPLVWSTGAPLSLLKACVLRVSDAPALFETAPLGTDTTTPYDSLSVPNQALSGNSPFGALVRNLGTKEIFKLSGRTAVWSEGLGLIKESPVTGFGFHADRLLLGTHMHNAVLHAALQTGLLGTIPFVAAMIFGWVLFFRMVRKLNHLSGDHKRLVIQCGGVLAFLTVRSFPESTGAFFGVDWLILALILFYLQLVHDGLQPRQVDGDHRILESA